MPNFIETIESTLAVEGETIEAVVIGKLGWGEDTNAPQGTVLTWEEAKPFFNYEYDAGYGAPECHAVYIWTATRVYFVVQYDGATSLESVPRNPVDEVPEMPGG